MPQPMPKVNKISPQTPATSDCWQHVHDGSENIVLSVARPGLTGILRVNPASSKCLEICSSGIQFRSNQQFFAQEKLVLDLFFHDTNMKELNAVVSESQNDQEGRWSTRANFCFKAKRMQKPSVTTKLLSIIDRLRMEDEFPLISPDP